MFTPCLVNLAAFSIFSHSGSSGLIREEIFLQLKLGAEYSEIHFPFTKSVRRPITYQLYRTNIYLLNLLILMTSDSDIEDDPVPEPSTDSPVVVHFGATGGCISYFGFVNIVDVSLFGAIMLRLVNAAHQKIKKLFLN